jgi:hypothetical protein
MCQNNKHTNLIELPTQLSGFVYNLRDPILPMPKALGLSFKVLIVNLFERLLTLPSNENEYVTLPYNSAIDK